ncbi:MAG: hypothetical protein JZU53_05260 [Paludibacter sp.]|jgi:hypothetical protein|nr:hypothetical protein [Paludibacter sp.]
MSNSGKNGSSLGEDMYSFLLEGKRVSTKIISKLNGTITKSRKRKEKEVQLATAKEHKRNAGSEPDK